MKTKKVMLTCYDASFAKIIARTRAVQYALVGDSMGMVIDGDSTTTLMTVAVMERHTRAVRAGFKASGVEVNELPLLISDLPVDSYRNPEEAILNSRKLLSAGAQMVKVEGPVYEVVRALKNQDIRVCAHIGLTPQSIQDFRVQGKSEADRARLLVEAKELEKAGAELIVLEMLPASLAKEITESLSIPTIGIGAGPATTGQVLVLYDLLGLNADFNPKFLKKYADGSSWISSAIHQYSDEVEAGVFPDEAHSFK